MAQLLPAALLLLRVPCPVWAPLPLYWFAILEGAHPPRNRFSSCYESSSASSRKRLQVDLEHVFGTRRNQWGSNLEFTTVVKQYVVLMGFKLLTYESSSI